MKMRNCLLVSQIIVVLSCYNLQFIKGTTCISEELETCTKISCDCCNDCQSLLLFIAENDTFLLVTNLDDRKTIKPIACMGNECKELKCKILDKNKHYMLKGKILKKMDRDVYRKLFFTEYKIVNGIDPAD